MRNREQEQDYLYASARVRALEAHLISKSYYATLAEAKDPMEVCRMLEECGIPVQDASTPTAFSHSLAQMMAQTIQLLASIAPKPEIVHYLQYPYDCHNLKAALKGRLGKRSYAHLLSDCASVSCEKTEEAVRTNRYDAFPIHMAQAAVAAADVYAKTQDPQQIDLHLDRACYADLLDDATVRTHPFLQSVLIGRIDLINLQLCARLLALPDCFARHEIFRQSQIGGSSLEDTWYLRVLDANAANFAAMLKSSAYSSLCAAFSEHAVDYTALERICDCRYLHAFDGAKDMLCGAPVLLAYGVAMEYQIKNLRILFTGKTAGLSPQNIMERLRVSDV